MSQTVINIPQTLHKITVCFCVSLAYLSFSKPFANELGHLIIKDRQNVQHYRFIEYQNWLNIIEMLAMVIPFVIYLLWYKSFLIKLRLNKALIICSIYSFFVAIVALFPILELFIITRFIQCGLLSIVYWTNMIEFMCLFSSRRLVPIALYFWITSTADLISRLADSLTLAWFQILIGLLFFVLSVIKFKAVISISKIKKSDDFDLMNVAFKGVRTSLAFFEIVSMSAMIVPLNLGPFLTRISLSAEKFNRKNGIHIVFQFLYDHNSQYLNHCSVAIFFGSLLFCLVSLTGIKKICLSFFAKSLLLSYIIVLIFGPIFGYEIKEFQMDIVLFTGLIINFSLKCYDIIKGFKRFLHLTERAPQLDFLCLKSFALVSIACLIGFALGTIMLFILMLFNDTITPCVKAIGQLFFVLMMVLFTFEALQNEKDEDNFMLYTSRPEIESEFVVTEGNSGETLSKKETLPLPDKTTARSNANHSNLSNRPNLYSMNNTRIELNSRNNERKRGQFFSNDQSNIMGTDLSPSGLFAAISSEPCAPSFINTMGSMANSFGAPFSGGSSCGQNDNRTSNWSNDRNEGHTGSVRGNGNREQRRRPRQQHQNQEVREPTPPPPQPEASAPNPAEQDDWD